LVEGWVLIVPRGHFISTGAFPPELTAEFVAFKQEVSSRLQALYGDICAFEHGPWAPSHQVGCGVDHAHVHLVPLSFSLLDAAKSYIPGVEWQPASWSHCARAVAQELDYLFVEQPVGVGRIAVADQFGSQILRRAISSHIGRPNEFDWRNHPHEQNIERTVNRFISTAVSI
jgi:diadenosine tetraphosphate (Ap4A) HIT family hydrolase